MPDNFAIHASFSNLGGMTYGAVMLKPAPCISMFFSYHLLFPNQISKASYVGFVLLQQQAHVDCLLHAQASVCEAAACSTDYLALLQATELPCIAKASRLDCFVFRLARHE